MIKRQLIFGFIISLLFCVTLCRAQETFVQKYTSYVTKFDDKLSEWSDIDLTVVFNEKNTNNVVLYYPDRTKTLYKIGNKDTNKTNDGEEYQIIECIDEEGNKLSLQLFSDAMRIIIVGGYIEFHK